MGYFGSHLRLVPYSMWHAAGKNGAGKAHKIQVHKALPYPMFCKVEQRVTASKV